MKTSYPPCRWRTCARLWLPLALAASLAACSGGGSSAGSESTSSESASAPSAQPTNTTGRLLASNCFQCHGTQGRGGFDNIRGSEADKVLEYLNKPAGSDIMAAHAQGYTREQLQSIISYLKR